MKTSSKMKTTSKIMMTSKTRTTSIMKTTPKIEISSIVGCILYYLTVTVELTTTLKCFQTSKGRLKKNKADYFVKLIKRVGRYLAEITTP